MTVLGWGLLWRRRGNGRTGGTAARRAAVPKLGPLFNYSHDCARWGLLWRRRGTGRTGGIAARRAAVPKLGPLFNYSHDCARWGLLWRRRGTGRTGGTAARGAAHSASCWTGPGARVGLIKERLDFRTLPLFDHRCYFCVANSLRIQRVSKADLIWADDTLN